MRKTKMKIWGRVFKLEVIYDVYEGEKILDTQKDALARFLDDESIADSALDAVIKYCLKDENMEGIDSIENIFKYVIPKSIYVKRSKKNREISLICNYRWDEEHGLEIVFKNEKFDRIRK